MQEASLGTRMNAMQQSQNTPSFPFFIPRAVDCESKVVDEWCTYASAHSTRLSFCAWLKLGLDCHAYAIFAAAGESSSVPQGPSASAQQDAVTKASGVIARPVAKAEALTAALWNLDRIDQTTPPLVREAIG